MGEKCANFNGQRSVLGISYAFFSWQEVLKWQYSANVENDMSEQDQPLNPTAKAGQFSVKFIFEKSPFYRTIHADGAWGRLDPLANIHMTFFNEKPQMPVSGVMQNTPEGQWTIDNSKLQFGHDAPLVREVDVDIILNVAGAVMVRDVLNNFIKTAMDHMQNAAKAAAELENQIK
jgi:hypothetical protein